MIVRAFIRYLPLLICAALWEGLSRSGLLASSTLPSLSNILVAWWGLAASGDLWSNGIDSLYRLVVGLLLAIVVGAVLGIAMASFRSARIVLTPLVELFYPIPKSALIPVTAVWLGFGDGSKILLIFLGCLLPVTLGAFNGARSTDQALMWSAQGLGARRLEVLWDVVLPSALPELLNGIRTALAFSFVLLVSSELVSAHAGLGMLIGTLGEGGAYEAMFAVVITIAALGFVADQAYQAAVGRAFRWR